MKLDMPCHTFNSYGGSGIFASVLALVELAQGDFGSALQEVELELCFRSRLPFSKQGVDRSLGSTYKEFHEIHCETLPKRRFLSKKAKLKIEVLATFASAEEINEPRKGLNLQWQQNALDALVTEIEHCRSKFKSIDDFRFNDFLGWLEGQRSKLPRTKKAAEALDRQWRRSSEKDREQMSEWERLGIDWEDYHGNARDLVSDPRLWSLGHDFAPNGNDSGSDVLAMFRRQKSRWARSGGKTFYKNLARDWEFAPEATPSDSFEYNVNREVVLGLAFAFIKLLAYCPDWLAELAICEIKEYQQFLDSNHLDWPHRDECLEYQALMLDCLSSCPRK